MGQVEQSQGVCVICGNVEPPFWWLSDEINPMIPCAPDMKPRVFHPSFEAALDVWGQLEGCTNDIQTGG